MVERHFSRTMAGMGLSPASQRRIVRSSRNRTTVANFRAESPEDAMAAFKSSGSLMLASVDSEGPRCVQSRQVGLNGHDLITGRVDLSDQLSAERLENCLPCLAGYDYPRSDAHFSFPQISSGGIAQASYIAKYRAIALTAQGVM